MACGRSCKSCRPAATAPAAVRRSGYDTQTKAKSDLNKVRALLDIADDNDVEGRTRLGDMLETISASKDPCPPTTRPSASSQPGSHSPST